VPAALHPSFPRYALFAPAVPVNRVTPERSGMIHRFHDTSPFSPSGRYLALTRLAAEDRLPVPGDVAGIVVVDLESGDVRTVAETRGADTQLGAHVQWGADDHSLYFNDVDTSAWRPFGVRLDPTTGERRALAGTVYSVSSDGTKAASPCLLRTARTQAGYGVIVPPGHVPRNVGAPDDDGLYVTDTATGASTLLVSIARIFAEAFTPAERAFLGQGSFYGFHAKWNPQGTRLMFVLRWLAPAPVEMRLNNVITMNADGSDIRRPITDAQWSRGGHHPNWCPDGDRVLMNLNLNGDGLRLVSVRHDGADLRALSPSLPGSGHPTLHPDGTHVLTDAYVSEPLAFRDGTTPIRWLDLPRGTETQLVRIRTQADFTGPRQELRVDSHPAWDREFRRIAFNACPSGKREVFVADLSSVVGAARSAA
jgi:hypothetical protein